MPSFQKLHVKSKIWNLDASPFWTVKDHPEILATPQCYDEAALLLRLKRAKALANQRTIKAVVNVAKHYKDVIEEALRLTESPPDGPLTLYTAQAKVLAYDLQLSLWPAQYKLASTDIAELIHNTESLMMLQIWNRYKFYIPKHFRPFFHWHLVHAKERQQLKLYWSEFVDDVKEYGEKFAGVAYRKEEDADSNILGLSRYFILRKLAATIHINIDELAQTIEDFVDNEKLFDQGIDAEARAADSFVIARRLRSDWSFIEHQDIEGIVQPDIWCLIILFDEMQTSDLFLDLFEDSSIRKLRLTDEAWKIEIDQARQSVARNTITRLPYQSNLIRQWQVELGMGLRSWYYLKELTSVLEADLPRHRCSFENECGITEEVNFWCARHGVTTKQLVKQAKSRSTLLSGSLEFIRRQESADADADTGAKPTYWSCHHQHRWCLCLIRNWDADRLDEEVYGREVLEIEERDEWLT